HRTNDKLIDTEFCGFGNKFRLTVHLADDEYLLIFQTIIDIVIYFLHDDCIKHRSPQGHHNQDCNYNKTVRIILYRYSHYTNLYPIPYTACMSHVASA